MYSDQLGTPRQVTDATQTVVWRWDSTPFGDSTPDEDPDGDQQDFVLNLRFPGQYLDTESTLNYNYFRDYDPRNGRYIESDPIGMSGGLNTFAYVADNPILVFDISGLKARVCCRKIPGDFGIRHCFIEFGEHGGRTVGLMGGRTSGEQWHTGRVGYDHGFDDPNSLGTKCGPWKGEGSECLKPDKCVIQAANEYPNPSEYRWRGPNSNTFAGFIARKCGLTKPDVSKTPGWNDSPAQRRRGLAVEPPKRYST